MVKRYLDDTIYEWRDETIQKKCIFSLIFLVKEQWETASLQDLSPASEVKNIWDSSKIVYSCTKYHKFISPRRNKANELKAQGTIDNMLTNPSINHNAVKDQAACTTHQQRFQNNTQVGVHSSTTLLHIQKQP